MTASLGVCPVCATPVVPESVVCAACGQLLVQAAADPMVGREIGSYRIVKRLGVGGMGAVYEAVEVNIERRAALKVIHPFLKDDAQLASLLAEARAVNAIGDEGIVDIYAFGTLPDGRAYLVMELLEGETLQSRLARDERVLVADAVELLLALSRVLEAAHASGFVHRDLKSANVFIVRRPNRAPYPKLLDFGIVHRVKSGGGEALGTPAYAAPEQVTHTNVGPKADLYALGVLAYELLTGQLPFDAPDGTELIRLHREAARPHPNRVVPMPDALDALIVSLMATEPHHRPASAGEVRARRHEVKAALAEPVAPLPQPARRTGLLVGALVAALVGIGVAGWALREPSEKPVTAHIDPVAAEIAQKVTELESKFDAAPASPESVDALLAAEASFPARAEWAALRGRATAALRREIARQLGAGDVDGAERSLAQLNRLGAVPADDALVVSAHRAAFAERNGMVKIGEVYVDRYEYPNRAGSAPVTQVDWADAVKLCEGAGKHLCSEEEWEHACRGSAGAAFPYGPKFEKTRCATKDKKRVRPTASGERAGCKTTEGVFDLSGNVAEWTSSPLREGAPQRVVRGGSFKQAADQVSCQARDYLLPGLGGAAHLGLRCCL